MKAGHDSVLGVCMIGFVGAKVLENKFESHQHLWKTHQIVLEIIPGGIVTM